MKRPSIAAVLALCTLGIGVAHAAPVAWTDWTTSGTSSVSGALDFGTGSVNVVYSGPYQFAQTSGGTNYWLAGGTPGVVDAPYTSAAVDNGPPDADIIALSTGGAKTITFSAPVVDPLLALVSWNGNTVDFGVPIEILSFGPGHWGNGTPVLNAAGTGFFGNGEVHGVIRIPGTFTSISFTDTSENWHGFTLGAVALAEPDGSVPEPMPLSLVGLGLLAWAIRSLRARTAR